MSRTTPRRRAVLTVRAVKAAATSGLAVTAIVLTLGGATAIPAGQIATEHGATADRGASVALARETARDERCRAASGQAIVRTPDGRERAVPFRQGWKVYRGDRPGELVAVCPG